MKVIDPGHMYRLAQLDETRIPVGQTTVLVFVKREGEKYPGNVGHHPGTTIQEVLRACIDRVEYLDSQIHDKKNGYVLEALREAIFLLELRAAERHGRTLFLTSSDLKTIEQFPTCKKCLHIGCVGECHL